MTVQTALKSVDSFQNPKITVPVSKCASF